jgi:hypothetical protein
MQRVEIPCTARFAWGRESQHHRSPIGLRPTPGACLSTPLPLLRSDHRHDLDRPIRKDTDNAALEKRLWDNADTATRVSASPECEAIWRDFRRAKDHWIANSGLKAL